MKESFSRPCQQPLLNEIFDKTQGALFFPTCGQTEGFQKVLVGLKRIRETGTGTGWGQGAGRLAKGGACVKGVWFAGQAWSVHAATPSC